MSEELTHATTGSDPSFSGCIVSDQKQTIRIIATRVMVQQATHICSLVSFIRGLVLLAMTQGCRTWWQY